MKILRILILGLLATAATVCHAQNDNPGWFVAPDSLQPDSLPDGSALEATNLSAPNIYYQDALQNNQPIAEAVTPDIQALANGLQDDPLKIYNYVQGNIRYVLYYGSKKGAELTLLEKSGNDFDQCSLLVALLHAAGYGNAAYQFGWMGVPYQGLFGSDNDLQYWWGLNLANTNWLYTSNYVAQLLGARGYPALYTTGDTNTFVFQRVWVTVTVNSTNYFLDPAFKFTQPVTGISLTNTMGFSSSNLLSVAEGTDTGSYVSGLNEANIRNTLTGYTTNLLNYIQTSNPNVSVQQFLNEQSIVPGNFTSLGSPLSLSQFSTYTLASGNYTNGTVSWTYIPTNMMSSLTVKFGGTNWQCWMPQLQGQRLSLTYSNNGVAQLWLNDSNVVQGQVSTSPGTNSVIVDINHPFGHWDLTNGVVIRVPALADNNVTNSYQSTNAMYALVYAFEPDWSWLQERENQLNEYSLEGYTNGSQPVVCETLNIMGLDWMLQTESAEQMLANQEGILTQYHHRFGRMAQEAGHGYYVDIYMQYSGRRSASGMDAANADLQNRHVDLTSYFDSALESGLLEQLQTSNLVAASTVKMLEIASTNGQAVYLASNGNWSAISGSLSGYNTSLLDTTYIIPGYYLLLPQKGTNQLAGPGTWAGYGIAARYASSTNINMAMLISGGYNGGYIDISDDTADSEDVSGNVNGQPGSTTSAPNGTTGSGTTGSGQTVGDPVDTADGTFQVEHIDMSLGQTEPKGITLSRYYNGTRRYTNPAGMAPGWINNYYVNATTVAAPQAAFGETTPAQAAALIAATCAAINTYSDTPDPKNWLTTALIAKWGVDQLTGGGVTVNLGKDVFQFVRQPNGIFTPPANCTLTLTKSGSAYALQERNGDTFNFNTAGQLSGVVDQYSNTLTVTYTNSQVSTVTDWKNRVLTFRYNSNGQLASVADNNSPSRSVSYGYSTNGDLISYTDPNGKTTTYDYDANHDITATIDANSNLVVSNFFDTLGHVTQQYSEGSPTKEWQVFWSGVQTIEEDPLGSERIFSFDNEGRLVSLQDQLGHVTQTEYDGQNHIIETISPLNEINKYNYDGNNNIISSVDPLNFTNRYIYDTNNNLIESIDANGHTNSFGYNAQFSLIGQTNAVGTWASYTYNTSGSAIGTLAKKTDPGGMTQYGYDSYGLVNSITYPTGDRESYTNNFLGDAISHTDCNGNTTSYQFDNNRQLTATIEPTNVATKLGYDAIGNLLMTTNARNYIITNAWSATRKLISTALPATSQGLPVITNSYDVRDWLAQTTDPLQQPVQYTDDLAGNVITTTDPLGRTIYMGYDADGRQTAITNAAGEKTLQQWSKRGQLVVTTDNAGKTVKRGYDGAGNQISLTNRNSNVWLFQYDSANRLTNTVSPMGFSNSVAFNLQSLPYLMTDAIGRNTTNTYDGRGRLITRGDSLATTTYNYDGNNNLTNVAESGLTNAWTYDAYNRVSSYRDVNGFLLQYRYDPVGNLTNLIYPGGRNVYYTYDSNNHVTQVVDWSGRTTTLTYDLVGHLTSITRPNGTIRSIAYDSGGEVTNITEETASKFPIAFYEFYWTNSARAAWEFGAPLPHTNTPPARTMTYDADNRLLKVNSTSVTNDANGNLTWGPQTNSTFTNYAYDARNRLLNVGGVTNLYDAMNNRIMQTQGTNATEYFMNPNAKLPQVLMRIKNGITDYYIYGDGLLYQITEASSGTNTRTYHYDYRGSTVALTDDSGNITDWIEYSLFGTTTYRLGTNDTPFLFNGRYGVQTDGNGLLYMQARYYNPYLCRFVNPDPSGFKGGLNFYAYANGNPVNYFDPSGLNAQSTSDSSTGWLFGSPGQVWSEDPSGGGQDTVLVVSDGMGVNSQKAADRAASHLVNAGWAVVEFTDPSEFVNYNDQFQGLILSGHGDQTMSADLTLDVVESRLNATDSKLSVLIALSCHSYDFVSTLTTEGYTTPNALVIGYSGYNYNSLPQSYEIGRAIDQWLANPQYTSIFYEHLVGDGIGIVGGALKDMLIQMGEAESQGYPMYYP